MDKRGQAQVLLEDAQRSLGKALSLLGGKTRNKPKSFPPAYKYVARQYIESVIVRLRVTQVILAQRDPKVWAESYQLLMKEYEKDRIERC